MTRIWAESDSEPDLLEALRRGRVFFADPSLFRGELWLAGPDGVEMGDVVIVRGSTAPPLRVRVTGVERGDLIAWYCNGSLVHAGTAAADGSESPSGSGVYLEEWQPPAPVGQLQAIRVEVRRPRLAAHAFGGLVACSNPIYLAAETPATGHRVHAL